MAKNSDVFFTITGSWWLRSYGKINDQLFDYYMTAWEEIFDLFTFYSTYLGNYSIDVYFDWSQIKNLLATYMEIKKEPSKENYLKYDREVHNKAIVCKISFPPPLDRNDIVWPYFVQNELFKIFITSNLAVPGCFNLYKKKLSGESEIYDQLFFNSSEFEYAWIESYKLKWPKIMPLSIHDTLKWFNSLNIIPFKNAKSTAQKTIFALSHFCQDSSNLSPIEIIWLSRSLESVYGSPKGKLREILKEKINLSLDGTPALSKIVSDKIDNFYRFRNKFVHGESEINYPVDSIFEDEDTGKYQENILENVCFVTGIIIGALQKMAKENLQEIVLKKVE